MFLPPVLDVHHQINDSVTCSKCVCLLQHYSYRPIRYHYYYYYLIYIAPISRIESEALASLVEVCGSTRTRVYGSGTGTKSTGRVYPFFTRKEHHFSRCWSYTPCFFISFFLANVNSRRYMSSSVRLSVVCNIRAPYLRD